MSSLHHNSQWFHMYTNKLKESFMSVDDESLKFNPDFKHACTAAILRLNSKFTVDNENTNNIHPFDVLYIQRALKKGDPWSGHIAFPGGRHEKNETLLQTAERETLEEVGLDISCKTGNYICLGCAHSMQFYRENKTMRVICYVFLQRTKQTPLLKLYPKEVANAKWINLSQFTQLPLPISNRKEYIKKLRSSGQIEKTKPQGFHGWTNMMAGPMIQHMKRCVPITNQVDLVLQYSMGYLPSNTFQYPAIILDVGTNHWLLWGMTYRMTGHLLRGMNVNNYMRFNETSRGSYGIGHQLIGYALYFGIKPKWQTKGVFPYFAKYPLSKL